ncbi:bifunctional 4-hydroxy-2-oxoglutarate aldolase/2-dehydro-3-deoxy-phosphogluconate aldolase [Mycolicibacterium sp. 624]|uniref:bifunctional 4-hydroxy-2-oxoglutarate aldolase/2-dehydro-3-deoxy-phosphogluconate aldolase n=1 Tax=Mycolicibacterium sp. 624 TaxID=3156314 RepID=UPI003398C499
MTMTALLAGGLPLIPVLTCNEPDALRTRLDEIGEAGILAVEVTLRTPRALDVIAACSGHDTVTVGAGTVLTPRQLDDVRQAGAAFAVSPGYDSELVERARHHELPYLPGVATSTEVLRACRDGVAEVKFFPAEVSGGPGFCAAMAEVYPGVRFVPTGGITLAGVAAYLGLPNVLACGGSWLTRPLIGPQAALSDTLDDIRRAMTVFT